MAGTPWTLASDVVWERTHRVAAWLFTGGVVSRDDLRLLAYLGETHQEIELLREKVPTLLGEA